MSEATIDHVQRVVAERGSDAWWQLPVEELLPPDLRGRAPRLQKGEDTMVPPPPPPLTVAPAPAPPAPSSPFPIPKLFQMHQTLKAGLILRRRWTAGSSRDASVKSSLATNCCSNIAAKQLVLVLSRFHASGVSEHDNTPKLAEQQ